MDIYFFLDDTILGGCLFAIISIIVSIAVIVLVKKIFKYKLHPIIPLIIIFLCRIIINEIVDRNDYSNFTKTKVNSIVVEQKELKASKRCKLKNGLIFYINTSAYIYIQKDDSIVKSPNSDYLEIYRKDDSRKYVLVKKCTYNDIR